MRKILVPSLLLIASALFFCSEPPLTEITWEDNLETAISTGKPVIADFYSPTCKRCKVLDESTFTDHDVIQLNRSMAFVKINGKEDTLAARSYGISGYPTVILLNNEGKEIDRIFGYEPPAEFLNTIALYMEGRETLENYLKRIETSPDSIGLFFTVGEKYEGRSVRDDARKYYMMVIEKDSDNKSGFTDDAMHQCGWLSCRDKNFQDAIDWERRIMKQFPESDKIEDAQVYIPYYYSKWAADEEKGGNKRDAKSLNRKANKLFKEFLKKYPESDEVEWVNKQLEELKEKL